MYLLYNPQYILSATEQEEEEGDKLDYESRVLLQFCKAQGHLLHTYTALQKLNTEPPSPANIQQSEQVCHHPLAFPFKNCPSRHNTSPCDAFILASVSDSRQTLTQITL